MVTLLPQLPMFFLHMRIIDRLGYLNKPICQALLFSFLQCSVN